MSQTKYFVWLSLCQSLSQGKVSRLLDAFGDPTAIYAAGQSELCAAVDLPGAQLLELLDKNLAPAQTVMDACYHRGASIVTLFDAAYPDRLRNIEAPPPLLYMKGRSLHFGEEIAVAVVGARRPSAYGLAATRGIVRELVEAGFVIVSGLAAGIDAAAHEAALATGGKTVAVLGSGIDICYPPENRRLMDAIEKNGLVMTEFPPGAKPLPQNFPRRNRILSGLAHGVLVGEASLRSGALITAAYALEQGRDTFAIPFPIDTKAGAGGNRLIKRGEAMLVTSGWDVAATYEGMMRSELTRLSQSEPALDEEANAPPRDGTSRESAPSREPPASKTASFVMPPEWTAEQRLLVKAVRDGAGTLGELARATGFPPASVLSDVTLLEMDGIFIRDKGRLAVRENI